MKTVYIVTSGSYSDYGIDSVWDNYKDAQKVADRFGGEGYVEEYVLNNASRPAKPLWAAHMRTDGFKLDATATDASDTRDISTQVWHHPQTGQIFADAYDVSPERAEKKLYDAIAEYKAKLNNL